MKRFVCDLDKDGEIHIEFSIYPHATEARGLKLLTKNNDDFKLTGTELNAILNAMNRQR
jgi:hypothetical protein